MSSFAALLRLFRCTLRPTLEGQQRCRPGAAGRARRTGLPRLVGGWPAGRWGTDSSRMTRIEPSHGWWGLGLRPFRVGVSLRVCDRPTSHRIARIEPTEVTLDGRPVGAFDLKGSPEPESPGPSDSPVLPESVGARSAHPPTAVAEFGTEGTPSQGVFAHGFRAWAPDPTRRARTSVSGHSEPGAGVCWAGCGAGEQMDSEYHCRTAGKMLRLGETFGRVGTFWERICPSQRGRYA